MKTNMKKIISLFIASIAFSSSAVMADSSLTSTDFFAEYPEHNIVQQTAKDKVQQLTNEQAKFLTSEDFPLGARAALINAMGFKYEGLDNATRFLNYLQTGNVEGDPANPTSVTPEEQLAKASADEIALYAYMLAMDNYFEVNTALSWALSAASEKPDSLTIQMITALIRSQIELDRNWCRAYTVVDNVRQNKNLTQDMKREAVEAIFKYIDGYKDECK